MLTNELHTSRDMRTSKNDIVLPVVRKAPPSPPTHSRAILLHNHFHQSPLPSYSTTLLRYPPPPRSAVHPSTISTSQSTHVKLVPASPETSGVCCLVSWLSYVLKCCLCTGPHTAAELDKCQELYGGRECLHAERFYLGLSPSDCERGLLVH